MPSTESYIGAPAYSEEQNTWEISLDQGLKDNFSSICDLATTIFEASGSALYANFPAAAVLLAAGGTPPQPSTDELQQLHLSEALSETVLEPGAGNAGLSRYLIVLPIEMPSGLAFGWLVFVRESTHTLTTKEKAILKVLHSDISNHLIQSKQAFQAATQDSLQKLITEHNDDWIFVKDEQFRIAYANNAFLEVYPEDMRDRVIGFTTLEEYDEEEASVFLTQDKIAFETGFSKVIEELHKPNGQHVIVETVKRRFEDEEGKRYILGICRDITQREDLIRELKAANDELGYFTSVASHDLKSPLNAIRRLLEWIEEDCAPLLPQEHLENMRLVVSRADRMQALLDDLLTYARIGKVDSVASDVSFTELYDDISQLLDVPEGFTVNVPDQTIHVAEVPFKTVILNLVSNAIKHNDKAQGVVDFGFSDSLHYYHIEISDNGPGIDPKYFDKIFQLFQTLRPRDEVEGSGIGLSVVMKYVSSFGGKVTVSSDGETGSTFRVSWPKRSLAKMGMKQK